MEGYQKLAKLGKGSYGSVFKARRLLDDRTCVVKIVSLQNISAEDRVSYLITHLLSLTCCKHLHSLNLWFHRQWEAG